MGQVVHVAQMVLVGSMALVFQTVQLVYVVQLGDLNGYVD